jgi:curli production assembly/transport component CsgG
MGLVNVGQGGLAAGPNGRYFDEKFSYAEAGLLVNLFPYDRFTPYLLAGSGITRANTADALGRHTLLPHLLVGLGGEYLVTPKLGVTLGIDNHLFFSDRIDRVSQGRYNDYFWGGRAGLVFYIGRNKIGQ